MNKYTIPNLAKACEVLEFVASSVKGCQLKDIVKALEIPRTTALRITQTLLASKFLEQTNEGILTLGTAMVSLGVRALDNLEIRDFARPILKNLSTETGESSHLAMLNGNHSLLVEVADSPHPVRIASRPGTLVDLHSSSTGKIFLAFAIPEPKPFAKNLTLIPHTPNTDANINAVLESIELTRKNGYAIDEEEYVLGVRCIAAPVTNAFGKTIAAIGITASTATFKKNMIPAMSKKLIAAAEEISKNMGFEHK